MHERDKPTPVGPPALCLCALRRARGVGRYGKYCSRRMFTYLAHFVSFVRLLSKRVGSHELMTSNQYKHGAQTTLIPFTI